MNLKPVDALRISAIWHTWGAQLVKHLTLDFGSGHGLCVREFEPHVGVPADSAEPAWDSLSPSLSARLLLSLSLK